jgi:hypothetical protein
MKKHIVPAIFALIVTGMMTVSAAAFDHTHSVWTNNSGGIQINDPTLGLNCEYITFEKFRTITSWTEISPGYPAQAHFRGFAITDAGEPCGEHLYEFTLNESTATTSSTITGYWDISRDGTLLCAGCTGQATGLNQAVTNSYSLAIDDPLYGSGAWLYTGTIDVRDDY